MSSRVSAGRIEYVSDLFRWGLIMRPRLAAAALAATVTLTMAPSVVLDSTATAVDSPPNVVLILVDDARLDDLASLPQIRSLVGDAGATYANAYSPFPLCCPARATILTGQYAHNHGVLENKAPLGGFAAFDDSDTLATWLTSDYTTGFIGKYLNEYKLPYRPPGWDHWMIPAGSVYDYRNPTWNLDGARKTYPGYRTDAMGTIARGFIETHADDAEPFMLFTSIVAPHAGTPGEPDDPSVVYGTSKFPTPNVSDTYRNAFGKVPNLDPSFNEADVSDKPLKPAPLATWEIDALAEVNGQRREALLSAQDAVRQIVEALQSTGELDNTYVIFASDNGYMMGDHRIRGGKVFPYEVTTHVPLLIRGPGIPAGSVVNQGVGLHDLAPTVLAMTDHTGSNGEFPLDGLDILPMIGNPGLAADRPLLIEAGPATSTSTAYRFHGIVATIDGVRWKYVERNTGKKELYNLTADPAELTNLAAPRASTAPVLGPLSSMLLARRWCAGAACR
jgi:N-acetylglucosamine-6-sulfatase